MLSDEYEKIDGENLLKAWGIIIDHRMNECLELANKNGPGAVIYKFLPREESKESCVQNLDETPAPNCQLYYVPQDKSPAWDIFFKGDLLMSKYDAEKHLLISVNIPTDSDTETTIGSSKLFYKDTLALV